VNTATNCLRHGAAQFAALRFIKLKAPFVNKQVRLRRAECIITFHFNVEIIYSDALIGCSFIGQVSSKVLRFSFASLNTKYI
jgi:hypothetical protein